MCRNILISTAFLVLSTCKSAQVLAPVPVENFQLTFPSPNIPNPDAISPFIPNLEQLYDTKAQEIVRVARSYLGTPHRFGKLSRKGTDCSGLTTLCFRKYGLHLPRSSSGQAQIGKNIPLKQLKIGDLVFFHPSPKSGRISHVGIISKIADNKIRFIHTSTTRGVVEDNFLHHHWQKRFAKAVRAVHLLPTISFCEP